jgi:predicted metal-dependent phosphotriesterase family hydrolase
MNVQMKVHALRTFVTPLLVHMHQKEKIALEVAAKITSEGVDYLMMLS